MEITIFTPTFNRARTLERLHRSIKAQNFLDFEWIIVDDGSNDDTEEVVQRWIKDATFCIRYFRQNNQGKHVAINRGVKESHGKLFFIVDSDDQVNQDALETIHKLFERSEIKADRYAGLSGTKIHEDGTRIGTMFTGKEYVDCTSLDRKKNNISGDKAEVFFTSVLKEYPFPVFEGEKFLNEAVVWNRIARDGLLLRWFDVPLIICEYLEGGLTSSKGSLQEYNPQGLLLYVRELIDSDTNILNKVAHRATYCGIAHNIQTNDEICKQLNISKMQLRIYDLIYMIRGNH